MTQEGLAVLTEVLAFASHPGPSAPADAHHRGRGPGEAVVDFLDVYRFFLSENYEPAEGYQHTMAHFRGGLPQGVGPFTKTLCYSRGFVLVYNFIRLAVTRGGARVPLLFCGKTNLNDLRDPGGSWPTRPAGAAPLRAAAVRRLACADGLDVLRQFPRRAVIRGLKRSLRSCCRCGAAMTLWRAGYVATGVH